MDNTQTKIEELLKRADPDVRKVLRLTYDIEKAKLHMSRPYGIIEELVNAIKRELK